MADEPMVWVSEGGRKYHVDRRCTALAEGRAKVADRGGRMGSLKPVALRRAKADFRDPCRTCSRSAR